MKKNKFLRGKVQFDEPHFKEWIEGNKNQVLQGCTKGEIVRVDQLSVFVQGSQIDIVDYLHSFLCKSLMQVGVKTSAIPKERKRSAHDDGDEILAKFICLEKHIKFCMQNFTTYIMCREHTIKDNGGKEVQLYNIVGVAIIEKNVRMTTGLDRSLIHY